MTPRLSHARMTSLGLLVACAGLSPLAMAQLRVVAWNVSNYGGGRVVDIQTSVYGSFSGRSMSPDVILGQEFLTEAALNQFAAALNTASGSPGDWAVAPFVDGADTESVCLYRTSKVTLLNGTVVVAVGSSSTNNQPRNTYRYDFRPVGYPAQTPQISMYSVHFKASGGSTDEARRLIEAQRIRTDAQNLPAGSKFVIGGDFNVTSSNDDSYIELIQSRANNIGRFFDPISTPGSWNNSSTYRFVHTQDPSGAGGMDDRYDFILVSGNLVDTSGWDYIGAFGTPYSTTTWNDPNHTYRCWGNDGTSFNLALTTTGNTMVGPTIAQALKNVSTAGGGHLPVLLDIRVPGLLDGPASIDFGTVPLNSTAQLNVQIGNGGNVATWTAAGIANVSYTLGTTAGFSAPGGSFNDAAGGALNSHVVSMNTATSGVKTGTLTVTSTNPDTPSITIPITGTVMSSNQPPQADAGPDQVVTDTDGNGTQPIMLDGSLSVDSDGSIIQYRWNNGGSLLASSAMSTSNVVLPVGIHEIQLTVTDNEFATGTDMVTITVLPQPNTPPTANAGPDQSLIDADRSGDELVTLDGSASVDSDGTITIYTWRKGEDVLASGSLATADVLLSNGVHVIELTVTDDDGESAVDTVTITINLPCAADFNLDGGVDGADIESFFIAFESGEATADVNQDGGVDGADVEFFFTLWEAGGC